MFNQIFSKKVVVPFFQFVGIIAIFTFIVFPGLTAADTIVNVFSVIIGFFTMLALYYFVINWCKDEKPNDEQIKSDLETDEKIKSMQDNIIKHNAYSDVVKKKATDKPKVQKSVTKKQSRFDQVGPK